MKRLGLIITAVALLALMLAPASRAAAPPLLTEFCQAGESGGKCVVPYGIATDPTTGDLYSVDFNRLNKFSPWGQFIKAWGGGVVTGGAAGTGVLTPGLTKVTSVQTTSKEFRLGMKIEGTGIAPGTTIAAMDTQISESALFLSKPATAAATGLETTLTSPEAPENVPTNELQRIVVTGTSGTYNLRFDVGVPESVSETTSTNIPYNASAGEVQAALESLPIIGPGSVEVTSANPGGTPGVPGGPYSVEFNGTRFADTDVDRLDPAVGSPPLPGGAAIVATMREGASAPEVCTGSECRAGVVGSGPGQFSSAQGISIDSDGDLYVYEESGGYNFVDCGAEECEPTPLTCPTGNCVKASGDLKTYEGNFRVQKFDGDGNFLLMFGRGVEKGPSHPGDLCTAGNIAEGDTCGIGLRTSGDGGFGVGPDSNVGLEAAGNYISWAPSDTVYIGGNERIQEFDTEGHHLRTLALPGEMVRALAVDGASASPSFGDLYVVFYKPEAFGLNVKANVRRLDPITGAEIGSLEVSYPKAVAVGPGGGVYVLEAEFSDSNPETINRPGEIIQFDPAGDRVLGFAQGRFSASSIGLAVSSACGTSAPDLFVANSDGSDPFIAIYGEQPDASICPPPSQPPSISTQFATSVDTTGATLKAKMNPHFWADTRYYVEYGTGQCSAGGCLEQQPVAPGTLLTKAVFDGELSTAAVFLQGLAPDTTYHFRFVASSGGGGPVRGPGGTETEDGAEGSFHTPPLRSEPPSGCANQAFRTGSSARLPDCRAYEMVSPVDKNNGDISSGKMTRLAQAAPSGDRMTFSSFHAFADPGAAPVTSQYLAQRRDGEGWSTESISPPRGSLSLYPIGGETLFQYKALSEDLCNAWLVQDSDLQLTPTAPGEMPGLYRRENCGSGSASYEALTSSPPLGIDGHLVSTAYYPVLGGFSVDGSTSVFRANAPLAVEEGGPEPALSCWPFHPGIAIELLADRTISYQWLRNGEAVAGATTRNYNPGPEDEGKPIQCRITESNDEGAATMVSAAAPIPPLPATPLPNPGSRGSGNTDLPGAPVLSGTPIAGETLSCGPQRPWSGSPTFAYQWLRNGVAIPGATSSTYALVAADVDSTIQCELAGSNATGTALADSEPLLVESRSPSASANPAISGTAAVGQVLSCAPGTWSGSPAFAYQWLRGGAAIASAASSTYTLVAADQGKAIQCRVAAANPDGTVAAVSPAVVVPPAPGAAPAGLTAPGAITGTAEVGSTLTCGPGTWSGSPTFTYRWLREGANIAPPKTAPQYTLEAADRGKSIQCQVTAANASGTNVVALDAPRYVAPSPPDSKPSLLGYQQVYVAYDGGKLRLVSVLPDGSPAETQAVVGMAWGAEGSFGGDQIHHAVSGDGERVFWNDQFGAGMGNYPVRRQTGKLYLRLNATQPQSTVSGGQCDEPEKACTIPVSEAPVTRFLAASAAGDRVIYGIGPELYEADIEDAGGHFVATSTPIASNVNGVLGASEDANRVYLVSTQVLSGSQANSSGDKAQPGEPNLYLYEKGSGFTYASALSDDRAYADEPRVRASRVTADGLHATFATSESLTGYDNADAASGQPNTEVYVFDATARGGDGRISCASCKPSGARPRGRDNSQQGFIRWDAAFLPGWTTSLDSGNPLSENGNRLFFNSYDALVPRDTNGKVDVYEWEAPGEGSCGEASPAFSETNDGCVYLISTGESIEDSEFFDATPSGADVFFATQSNLLPQDRGLTDVYDARVGGGFPAPAAKPASCEGEACQGAAEPPNDPTPASSSFRGAGNVTEGGTPRKPCAKGKARRKGRCVRKGKANKHRSKTSRASHDRRNGR
jgi:hypothetical protein